MPLHLHTCRWLAVALMPLSAALAQPTDQGVSLAGCARVGAVAGASEPSIVTLRAWHVDHMPLVGAGLVQGSGDRVLVTLSQVVDADRIDIVATTGETRTAFVLAQDTAAGIGILALDRPLPAASPLAIGIPSAGTVGFAISVIPPSEEGQPEVPAATPFLTNAASGSGGFATALRAQCGSLSGPAFNGTKQFLGWHLYERNRTRLVGPQIVIAAAQRATIRGLAWRRRTGFSSVDASERIVQAWGVPAGAVVTSVDPAGPAAASGLQEREVITAINGATVRGFDDLGAAVDALPAGASVTLAVVRDAGAVPVRLVLKP